MCWQVKQRKFAAVMTDQTEPGQRRWAGWSKIAVKEMSEVTWLAGYEPVMGVDLHRLGRMQEYFLALLPGFAQSCTAAFMEPKNLGI